MLHRSPGSYNGSIPTQPCWILFGVTFTRITTDSERMGGVPCLRGLRFPVATVVAMVAEGMTAEEILDEHGPDLEAADLAECLRFAALAAEERELALRQRDERLRLRPSSG